MQLTLGACGCSPVLSKCTWQNSASGSNMFSLTALECAYELANAYTQVHAACRHCTLIFELDLYIKV